MKEGVLVKAVNKDSAAEKAGLKAGDVITKVDDSHVNSTTEITRALRGKGSRSSVTLTVVRNKKEMTLTVNLEAAAPARAIKAGFILVPGQGFRFGLELSPNHGVI